jgi:hypothetical protein
MAAQANAAAPGAHQRPALPWADYERLALRLLVAAAGVTDGESVRAAGVKPAAFGHYRRGVRRQRRGQAGAILGALVAPPEHRRLGQGGQGRQGGGEARHAVEA